MAEGAVQGILAVLHGREEILEPAPGNTVQFGVELIEEDQRDLVLPPVQRFLQGLEQFHRVAVLGKVQCRDDEAPAGLRDLLHAEGFARAGRSEDRDGQRLQLFVIHVVVIAVDVILQQSLDGVIALHLVLVHRRHFAVAAHRYVLEKVVRSSLYGLLRHREIPARLALAVFVKNGEGGVARDQSLQTALRHRQTADQSRLQILHQLLQDRIQWGVLRKGQPLAVGRREQERPLFVLPDQRPLLVQTDHHVLPVPQGPQRVVCRQLQKELIDSSLIGDASRDGEIQFPEMRHLEDRDLVIRESLRQRLRRDICAIG